METMPVIETRGLVKTYKGVQALQALDLKVTQNSICGFLGPNGAGKTTTIKLLLGLARPSSGLGTNLGVTSDLDGRLHISRWDSGAYQYYATTYLPMVRK